MSVFHPLRWNRAPAETFLPAANALAKIHLDWYQMAEHAVQWFDQQELITMSGDATLAEAEALFDETGARYAMLVDGENKLIAVLSAKDIHGRQTVTLANLLQMPWKQIAVRYIGVPIEQLPVLTSQQVENNRIGDMAATMQDASKDFILVSENEQIVGVIAALKILELTGESVRLTPRATSFAEIFNAIKHPEVSNL